MTSRTVELLEHGHLKPTSSRQCVWVSTVWKLKRSSSTWETGFQLYELEWIISSCCNVVSVTGSKCRKRWCSWSDSGW